jgi:hypothetical protein
LLSAYSCLIFPPYTPPSRAGALIFAIFGTKHVQSAALLTAFLTHAFLLDNPARMGDLIA